MRGTPEWTADASCLGLSFVFDEDTETGEYPMHEDAVRICNACPVQKECLNYAVKNKVTSGIWGGRKFSS